MDKLDDYKHSNVHRITSKSRRIEGAHGLYVNHFSADSAQSLGHYHAHRYLHTIQGYGLLLFKSREQHTYQMVVFPVPDVPQTSTIEPQRANNFSPATVSKPSRNVTTNLSFFPLSVTFNAVLLKYDILIVCESRERNFVFRKSPANSILTFANLKI